MYIYEKSSNKIYEIKNKPVSIGRSKECDIILNDLEISRKHTILQNENGNLIISDLESKNGVYVNDIRINKKAKLKNGDIVEVGRYVFDVLDNPPIIENSGVETHTDLITLNLREHLDAITKDQSCRDFNILREEVLDIIKKLNSIYQFIGIINSSWDLEDILDKLLNKVMEIMGSERGAILINKLPEDILMPLTAHKIEREIQTKTSFSMSRVIIEKVQAEKKTILIEDAMIDKTIDSESVIASRIRSVLASPVKSKDNILGIIYLDHREKAGVFNKEDIGFFESIASIAAIAINNSNYYTKTIKQKDRYYRDKVSKNFELYKNRLLSHLKEGLDDPLQGIADLLETETVQNNSDLHTLLGTMHNELKNIISELIKAELPALDAPVFESYDINITSLVSEIYKNIFPYAYLKDIKVFFKRPANKKLYIKGDFSYIKEVISEILYNIVDILEDGAEITLKLDERKFALDIEYVNGPIFLEERSLNDFLDEKVMLDVKSYSDMLRNKISFSRQRDRKGKMSILFSQSLASVSSEETVNLVYKFEPKFRTYIEKDQNRVLVFFKKDTEYFKLIKDYVKLIGFDVSEVYLISDIIEKTQAYDPNIILLDYGIVEDNPKNIELIKAIKEKKDCPIILMCSSKNISREIFGSGIDDIMFVPFKLEELELRMIHSLENSLLKQHILEIEKIETVKAMIASISHELNNPLTTASINAELIKMTAPQNMEYVERILSSLGKMKDIVERLSNLKKVSFKDYLRDHKMINLGTED